MPLVATRGAASVQGFGEFAQSGPVNYIEDVFSTWLYAGNGATQTITNGIDLSTYGGMVWTKGRNSATNNCLTSTGITTGKYLFTNSPDAVNNNVNAYTGFTTTGYGVTAVDGPSTNSSGVNYVGWTFRKQPKFFDVVTWTGNGVSGRQISHALGSVPGCILVKSTSLAGTNWAVYHRSLTSAQYALQLNNTGAQLFKTAYWNSTAPTSTVFTLGNDTDVNENGGTYIAYLFAHDAGGFGLSGTDNVISCGSFTVNGSGDCSVSLGYEPQWLMVKSSTTTDNWYLYDNMRGFPVAPADGELLRPNTSQAGITASTFRPTSTGFVGSPGTLFGTGIYVAIRRGPMKTPTTGTSVFSPNAVSTDATAATTNFPVDLLIEANRAGFVNNSLVMPRLTGGTTTLVSSSTAAEFNPGGAEKFQSNTSITPNILGSASLILWNFRRAPGFFDVVCFTTDGSGNYTGNHNLSVTPELIITKRRNGTGQWWTYCAYSGTSPLQRWLLLNDVNGASGTGTAWWATSATSFSTLNGLLAASATNVAYLFASCPGVSKVGAVTHVEPTTVTCGFPPRFVLIKSTTTTGTDDWFVFDSARGITANNDPYLRLNSSGAENTPFGAADLIDPTADGFIMNGFGGGNYIFLAIA